MSATPSPTTAAQVGVASGVDLPPAFSSLYENFGLFAFQGLTVPAACIPGYSPLTWMVTRLVALLAVYAGYLALLALTLSGTYQAWLVRVSATDGDDGGGVGGVGSRKFLRRAAPVDSGDVVVLEAFQSVAAPRGAPASACGARACARAAPRELARAAHTTLLFVTYVLMITYSASALAVIESVTCDRSSVTVAQYLAMFRDGTTLRALGVTAPPPLAPTADAAAVAAFQLASQRVLFPVLVLRSDPSDVCYEGAHRAVAALAWLLLIAFVLGFPALTAALMLRALASLGLALRRTARTVLTSSKLSRDDVIREQVSARRMFAVQPLTLSFFRPTRWWFWHLEYGFLVVLPALAQVGGDASSLAVDWARLAIVVVLAAVMGALYAAQRPFARGMSWMLAPKLTALVLVAVLAALQFCGDAASKVRQQPAVAADPAEADAVARRVFGLPAGASAALVRGQAALGYLAVVL